MRYWTNSGEIELTKEEAHARGKEQILFATSNKYFYKGDPLEHNYREQEARLRDCMHFDTHDFTFLNKYCTNCYLKQEHETQ